VESVGGVGVDGVDGADSVGVEGGDDDAGISVFFPFPFALVVYLCWYSLFNCVCVL
jgi:hypothetical protein